MISGFRLPVFVASFIILFLLLLITRRESSYYPLFVTPVVISWSVSLPNATLFTHQIENATLGIQNQTDYKNANGTHLGDNKNVNNTHMGDNKSSNSTHLGDNKNANSTHLGDNKNVNSTHLGDNKNANSTHLGDNKNVNSTHLGGNKNANSTHLGDNKNANSTHLGDNKNVNHTQLGNVHLKKNNESAGVYDVSLAKGEGKIRHITPRGGGGGFEAMDQCNIFDGKWERDDDILLHYEPGSCPLLDVDFDCHLNGRPDKGYYYWRWKPNGCSLPRLNATDFLERLRGKKLAFVGDSLNREMWESLICILRNSIQNKTKVYEISGRSEFKKEGFYSFRFEDYNSSIDFIRSPFLVKESTFPGKKGEFETLRLDLMDETTKMYGDAHVLVFNTGHWWSHEKTFKGEDFYQEGNYVYPKLEEVDAYQKALTTWGKWIDTHVNRNKTLVFFRGYSLGHFSGGQWNTGGQCHTEMKPIFNDSELQSYPPEMAALDKVMNEIKTPVIYLNISRLTDYRKDAHPSIYRKPYQTPKELIEAEQAQDCSHWCLPGVPDTWNQLFYVSLLKAGL